MAKLKLNLRPVRRDESPFARLDSAASGRSGGPETAQADRMKTNSASAAYPGASAEAMTSANGKSGGNESADPFGVPSYSARSSGPNAAPSLSKKGASAAAAGNGNTGSEVTDVYTDLYGKLREYGVTSIPTLAEFIELMEKTLRPSVDEAISERTNTARANMAEMDADAYSRGMGGSSYLSSVKERERAGAASDVMTLEQKYSSSVADRLCKAVDSMREMESDISKTRMKLEAEKEAAEAERAYKEKKAKEDREYAEEKARKDREYAEKKAKEDREYAEQKEREKRAYAEEKEKKDREYAEEKAKKEREAKLKETEAKAKAQSDLADKKARSAMELQKEKGRQAEKLAKLKAAAAAAAAAAKKAAAKTSSGSAKNSKSTKNKSSGSGKTNTSAKTSEKGSEAKYGHNKNGSYFDGKWYSGDYSYLKKDKYTYVDYSNYLKGLTASERYLFFTSDKREWRMRRWQVQYNIPQSDYKDLYDAYMPGTKTASKPKTKSAVKAQKGGKSAAKKGGGKWQETPY